jgi:hypothetical protein
MSSSAARNPFIRVVDVITSAGGLSPHPLLEIFSFLRAGDDVTCSQK